MTKQKQSECTDAASVIAALGGAPEVARKFKLYGCGELTTAAVYKWLERNSIPVHRVTALQKIAKREGVPFDLDKILASLNARKAA